MDMHKLRDLLPTLSGRELLLDVRTPEEFKEGHIVGARNITHEEVGSFAEDLKQFGKVIVFCRSGKRAQLASKTLKDAGLTNVECISDGGMMQWIEAGYPIECG